LTDLFSHLHARGLGVNIAVNLPHILILTAAFLIARHVSVQALKS